MAFFWIKFMIVINPQNAIEVAIDKENYLVITEYENDRHDILNRIFIHPLNIKKFTDGILNVIESNHG